MKTFEGSCIRSGCTVSSCRLRRAGYKSCLELGVVEGDNFVCDRVCDALRWPFDELRILSLQLQEAGKHHLNQCSSERLMVYKHRKGMMHRTSKCELNRD